MQKATRKSKVIVLVLMFAILLFLLTAVLFLINLADTAEEWDILQPIQAIQGVLSGLGNRTPDFADWPRYQIGVFRIHVPAALVSEETCQPQWEYDITRFESAAGAVSILITRMVHNSELIHPSAARSAEVARLYLERRTEEMETVSERTEGTVRGIPIPYLVIRGEDQGRLFEMRSFSIEYEVYFLAIFVEGEDEKDLISQFFNRIVIML